MRIVQAIGSSGRVGTQRFFIRLVKALDARGVSQSVLVPRKAWAAEKLSQAGADLTWAAFAGKLDFITRFKYRRALQRLPATFAIGWTPNAISACPAGPWIRIGRLSKTLGLDRISHCDHVIASSPRLVSHVKGLGWPTSRVSYIPNFVPEVHAQPVRRAAFNTPDDAPLVVWLGRMNYRKGPDLLVRALSLTPDVYLWMAGSGAYERAVKSLAAELGVSGRIRFLGWRDDIHALLKTADLFVRSSRDEGLGYILEAWAAGTPVISTRSEDAELVIADGQSGLLVPNDDPVALSRALRSLGSNRGLARRLAEAGGLRFRATFSEEPVVTMYLELFHELERAFVTRVDAPASAKDVVAEPKLAQ